MLADVEAKTGVGRPYVVLGWCVLLLVGVLFCFVIADGAGRWTDFRAFYAAGEIVRTAPSRLYDPALQQAVEVARVSPRPHALPFYHPAYEALLYAPFSMAGFRVAYVLFAALNLVLLGMVLPAAPEAVSERVRKWPRAWMILTFLPALLAVVQGQNSILQLVLCCWSLRRLRAGDGVGTGALIALGMFRPQIAVPLALLLGVRAGWKFAAGFVGTCAGLAAVSVGLVGWGGVAAWWRLLQQVTMAHDQSRAAQIALGISPTSMPNLRGLLALCGAQYLPPGWSLGLTMAASAAVMAVGWWLMRRTESVGGRFGVAVVCAVLVSYHLNSHDAALLLLPMLLLSGPGQGVLVGLGYGLPYVLYGVSVQKYFALLAVVPLGMLWSAVRQARRERECVGRGFGELRASS